MTATAAKDASAANATSPKYVHDPAWGRLPDGVSDWGVVPAVVVDSEDRVYVHRRAHPSVVVYNRHGEILTTWGERFEAGAHGLHLEKEADGEEYLYFTDTKIHSVVKCTLDGRELWTLGSGQLVDGAPFNRPTDISLAPEGGLYVGYLTAVPECLG